MFADFSLQKFPYVIVKLNSISCDDDFKQFTQGWLALYANKKNFTFVFDTTNVSLPPIKYAFAISNFIKNLRKEKTQYLEKSIIIVKNKLIINMLEFIFLIQPPLANVYLVDNDLNYIENSIDKKEDILTKINIIKNIKPGKPFLPFL